MIKALLWKEWRQQRQIAAAGIGIALVLPPATFGILMATVDEIIVVDVVDMIPFMMAVFIWPLFAALAGAMTSAEEVEAGSLGFLLSRPVSRTRVWATKVVVAGAVVALVVAVSFFIAKALGPLAGDRPVTFPFSGDPIRAMSLPPAGVRVAALGFTGITFAAAVFLSMFLRRQVVAALGGVVVAAAIVMGGSSLQRALSGNPSRSHGSESFMAVIFLAAGATILGAALYVFLAGGMLSGADKRRPLGRAVTAVALVVFLVTVVSAEATTRIDPDRSRLGFVGALPDGSGVIVSLERHRFGGQAFAVAVAGEPLTVLTGRMAESALVTPDGQWVVYSTRLGFLGFRREYCQLRAVRVDGSENHPIFDRTPCYARLALARDGKRAAMMAQASLSIFSLDESEPPRSFHLVSTAAAGGWALEWIHGDTGVVVLSGRGLSTIDVETGEVTSMHGNDGSTQMFVRVSSESAVIIREWASKTRREGDDESVPAVRLAVVDLETGTVRDLPSECPESYAQMRLSADGKTVVYRGCRESGGVSEWTLYVYRVDTGKARTLTELDSPISHLSSSPAASRLLVRTYDYDAKRRPRRVIYRNLVIDGATGALLREVDDAWNAGEWIDEERLVVFAGTQIARLDVNTGNVEVLAGSR